MSLGHLLGMKFDYQIYRALGRTKPFRKLSSKYALRLAYLYQLQAYGVVLGLIRSINWETGVIEEIGLKSNDDSKEIPKAIMTDHDDESFIA